MPKGLGIWSHVLPGYYTMSQAQAALGISRGSARNLIEVMKPRVKKIGCCCFVSVEDWERWCLDFYKPEKGEQERRTRVRGAWNYPMGMDGKPYGVSIPEVEFNHLNVTMHTA